MPPYSRDDPIDPNRDPAATRPRTLAHSPCPYLVRTILLTEWLVVCCVVVCEVWWVMCHINVCYVFCVIVIM
jgi:hypothetical protein